jgi:hypothetical protein
MAKGVRSRLGGRSRRTVSFPASRHRQPFSTEALGESLRVFRLGKAEHYEVAVITAQGIRERSCR